MTQVRFSAESSIATIFTSLGQVDDFRRVEEGIEVIAGVEESFAVSSI